ncbi:FadR/GntR family transcriptional regulator [Meiothermus taiwanensis]|jgi:GntR family transcriptional repressor for pyruvate dehydrogenase complex|uniref:HTH-type transcriptional regulator LutR n=2 Tax=Meiothermus taiwanensis TaxID=172827 RepID=A0A399E8D4_9DEIN|nr:FadR/GntR family transcriptional regulator [Meiothermus taiwanensis]AWR86768.1 transcriptional regulator [Meiothermus taiwanensis WR-220]KIQ55300.1 GntR family transcriptional regulator [Meiothermus taiwanensis]KZK15603.1 GntR family transcriptional regulator [Meiothermus taiwanensis]RIH79060.1 HTH-type transcriptional regulator LutR [Meiothermus taiwanensis]
MVRPTRVSEKLAKDLEQLLQDGVWRPGDQLPGERDLASRFGVSRSSVREALRILELHGWVEIRQGDGTRVASPSESFGRRLRSRLHQEDFIVELFEVRRILEPAVAALAAERSHPQGIARLEELLAQQQAAKGDLYRFVELDMFFHKTLADMSRNAVLSEIVGLLEVELRQIRLVSTAKRYRPQVTLSEHLRILEAIRASDPEAARQAMLAHLSTVESSAKIKEVDR